MRTWQPSSAQVRTVRTAEGPIEVAEAGQGIPVLAIHGGMGGYDQGLILAGCMLGDEPGFRIVAPSRPGYLGTPFAGRDTPQRHAQALVALLDALGVERALVMAISAGGPSSITFARCYPERCAGLVLVSAVTGALQVPPGAGRRLPYIRLAARIAPLARLIAWLARTQPDRTAARSILDEEIRRATMMHAEAGPLMRALQEGVASRIGERLDATLRDVAAFNAMAPLDLAALRVPVLAIHGTGDRVVPVSHLDRVADALPSADIMRISDGEHVCVATHLEEIRARARTFADRCATDVGRPASRD